MSGSASVGGGTIQGTTGTSVSGPFQTYNILTAEALDAALLYGNKLGGTLDNVTIGQTTPGTGAFTSLTAQTPPAGDNTNKVATTAWVQTNGGGGGGGSISLNSPNFTGIPTAPTATAGTNTQQIATTAFIGNALSNTDVGTLFAGGGGNPGWLRDNGSGTPNVIRTFDWPTFHAVAASNWQWVYEIPFPVVMTSIRVEAPGAAGGTSFPVTMTQNGSAIGATYTGTSTSTSPITLGSPISFSTGDRLVITIGAMTGSPGQASVQPHGNIA